MVTPIVSSKYRHLYQFCYVKVFSTNHNGNLVLLNDPGRVRSQIASIVRQIQRFDFDRNLVVTKINNMNTVTFRNKTSIYTSILNLVHTSTSRSIVE